jgi:ankyrin repeat protein
MTPDIQPSEEQKKEFFKALEDFQQSKGLELRYQKLLEINKNLENYFKELIESAIYNDELDFVGLLLSEDPEVSKIKIDNKSILFLLIKNFIGDETAVIISNHIKKFDSIGEDKDDGDNLIVSLFCAGDYQEVYLENSVKKIIEALVANGVSVNDKNNSGTTPLDLCWNFEIFKTLAQHASQETLEKKLRYIVENEDLASEDEINITKFLLTEKNVKIDGFFDWKWPEIPIYLKAIFAQIILDHGNDEQKKCLTDYSKSVENSPFFAIIDDDIRFDSEPFNFREEFRNARIAMAIILNKNEALEKIIRDNPKILEEKVKSGLTPVFYAIWINELNALEAIIRINPKVLDQKDQDGLTPVLYAINKGKLDALKKIISASTEVLDRKDENGFTPVFHAIWFDKLDALEKIIKARSAVLDQKDKSGLTPVLYAIKNGKLDALKKIIEASEGALEQKNQQGENPILYSLNTYSNNPSDSNKKILKLIFQKQFGRDLQDEEIKNLVEFVNNYNFLKLFYNEYGQGMDDIEFKSIVSSILPSEEELESELSKNLLKICQTIAQAKEKPSIIECHDASEDKTELHIHHSQLSNHASYFIFHVNAQNKLTKISYCDGHGVFLERGISRQIEANQSPYIYGATTFELKESMDFIPQFGENFVNENSKGKTTSEFRLQHFSRENLESKEIFGCKFSGMTHSIPTKMQSRGNCSLKSFYVTSRHLLEIQHQIEKSTTDRLFTYDEVLKAQGGEGYKSYKDLRQKMVDKAGEKLFESVKNLEKNFLDSIEFFKKMNSLMDRSSMKEERAKPEKSTTKLLQTTLDFIDQINRNKLFKDNLVLDEVNHQKHFNLIATSHLNLSQEDVDKIKFLYEKQEVKIDNFLDWNFQTSQAKNNFVKLVFDYGDEVKKGSFIDQLVASNPEKREKFFKDLSKENLSLILTAFEKQKSKFENLEQTIESLKASKKDNPYGVRGCISKEFYSEYTERKNNYAKKVEDEFSEQGKDDYIYEYLNANPIEREEYLSGLEPKRLSFMLNHSQNILKKLENSDKIITELKAYAQRIDQNLVVEAFSEATIARYKRSADEKNDSDDDPSTSPSNKKQKLKERKDFSVKKCSSSGSLQ